MNSYKEQILDKEWLDRVYFAYYNVYIKQKPSKEVEEFITWLFKQYGYVEPK